MDPAKKIFRKTVERVMKGKKEPQNVAPVDNPTPSSSGASADHAEPQNVAPVDTLTPSSSGVSADHAGYLQLLVKTQSVALVDTPTPSSSGASADHAGPVQEITGIEPTTTDNQDGGVREDNDPIYQDPRLFVETVMRNKQDWLTRPLDRAHRWLSCWEHLACTENIKAPLETRLRCKLKVEYSHTERLMEILVAEKGDTELQEFVKVLGEGEKGIRRNDVVKIVKEYHPGAENSTVSLRDIVASYPDLIEKMVTKLDQESPSVKNWKHLGRAFSISEERLKEITYRYNPTYAVMEYNFSSEKPMTVKTFREIMKDFKRLDVVKIMDSYLQESVDKEMKDVVSLDSDTMSKICICLNDPNNVLKNWRHLANFLGINKEIYDDFNPNDLKSPTALLFDWISATKPELTVGQFCCALKDIERFDLVRDVKKHLE